MHAYVYVLCTYAYMYMQNGSYKEFEVSPYSAGDNEKILFLNFREQQDLLSVISTPARMPLKRVSHCKWQAT